MLFHQFVLEINFADFFKSFLDSSDEANDGDAFEFVKKHSVKSGFDEKAEVILKSALEERHQNSSSEDEDSGKIFFMS